MSPEVRKLVKAGPIGRLARVGLGLVFLWLFVNFAIGYDGVVQPGNVVLYFWAIIGAYSHALGTLIPPLRDSRRRFVLLFLLAILAFLLDFLLYSSWWGVPLAMLLYGLALAVSGVLGVEFVLAGMRGYLGCESTAIHNLLHRESPPEIEPCPLWDPIDRWERRFLAKRAAGKLNENGG